jgi:hypothetical protein
MAVFPTLPDAVPFAAALGRFSVGSDAACRTRVGGMLAKTAEIGRKRKLFFLVLSSLLSTMQ